MRRVIVTSLITLLAIPAFASEEPKTEEQKTLYAVGHIMASQLSYFNLTSDQLEFVKEGMKDGALGRKPVVDMETYSKKAQEMAAARRDSQGEKLTAVAKKYMEKAEKEKGAVKTASGVIYQPLSEGKGASPAATDIIKVNYRGTLVDGKLFDSSYTRGQPGEFPLNKVIKCWTEGIQMMKAGGKARLACPPDTAYGKKASALIPPNSTLVFEVELLEVTKRPQKPSENKGHAGL